MKHYTSKLSTYSDLATLETFGFRGEALSSLCALSHFTVTTCRQAEAPKGTKLDFETSGKLKGTTIVAAQKGTTVSVENLFQNLPVRRRELERNIKREWGKVISLLNQYACIQTGVKFTVSQTPNKGKRIVLFSTKGNKTTRENIVNVFGAKTISALAALDLKLELEATSGPSQRWTFQEDSGSKEIMVKGYVSRPNHGEGRQTPDRQMFYVNSRPCGLPQFAKVFNEVYKSFNSSQSPFIFADIQLDTHLYDVNVSPDKRTILLHDQTRMLDNLRDSLTELFEKQDYTMPVSQIATFKQPAFKKPTITRQETAESQTAAKSSSNAPTPSRGDEAASDESEDNANTPGRSLGENMAAAKSLARNAQASDLMARWMDRKVDNREEMQSRTKTVVSPPIEKAMSEQTSDAGTGDDANGLMSTEHTPDEPGDIDMDEASEPPVDDVQDDDFLGRLARLKRGFFPESLQNEMSDSETPEEAPIPAIARSIKPPDNAPVSISNARLPKRSSQEVATITVGDHTVTSMIGTPSKKLRPNETPAEKKRSQRSPKPTAPLPSFNGRLTQMFAAAGAKGQDVIELGSLRVEDEADIDKEESEESEGDDTLCSPKSAEDGSEQAERTEAEDDEEQEELPSGGSSPLFVEQDEDALSVTSPRVEDDEIVDESDGDYVDKENHKAQEDIKVQDIIEAAEGAGQEPSEENQKRTKAFIKGPAKGKYLTNALLQRLKLDVETLSTQLKMHEMLSNDFAPASDASVANDFENGLEADNAEETLALTIHKGDFGKMKIIGQFNLGFVLAVRPSRTSITVPSTSSPPTAATQRKLQDDELFIIDQHASDEKFNFERLQATTTVQSQRLVRPKPLELTAVEEEIVIENQSALEKNGFIVEVDESGDEPVGSRCQLLALPLSRETTFTLADLEELISLLGDNPTTTNTTSEGEEGGSGSGFVPRPSKVRKMFAMRACRSSIMIGKALSRQQMERVVRHMGDMEKPWNCPHGRPTMRHLCGLGSAWNERGWREGDAADSEFVAGNGRTTDWAAYIRQRKGSV